MGWRRAMTGGCGLALLPSSQRAGSLGTGYLDSINSNPAPGIELSLQSVLLTFSHRKWFQRAFVCSGFSFGQHKRGNKGNAEPLYLGATGHPTGQVQKCQRISALLFCMLGIALNIADRHLKGCFFIQDKVEVPLEEMSLAECEDKKGFQDFKASSQFQFLSLAVLRTGFPLLGFLLLKPGSDTQLCISSKLLDLSVVSVPIWKETTCSVTQLWRRKDGSLSQHCRGRQLVCLDHNYTLHWLFCDYFVDKLIYKTEHS